MGAGTCASWIAVVAGTISLSCGGGGAKAPNPTRPIDESRAVEIIRRALEAEGIVAAAPRMVQLRTGEQMRVDVGVEGHTYGVSYITEPEARGLGAAIPPRNLPDERLHVALAGSGLTARIVLLYEQNYVHDDLMGEEHEKTAIAAERQLERDVRDFITHAKSESYP